MERERSSIIGFALAGLAVGAAAWYLFGTKEGRENFDRAVEGINEVSSKLQKKAMERMEYASERVKNGMDCASDLTHKVKDKAEKFSDKFHDASNEAKDRGKKMARDAKDLANKAAHSVNSLTEDAKDMLKS